MKKTYIIGIVICFIFNTSIAQDDASKNSKKGTYIIGANTNLASTAWTDIPLNPSVGYFISEKFAMGLRFNLDALAIGNASRSSYHIAPWLRAYLNEKRFLMVGVDFYNITNTVSVNGVDISQTIDAQIFSFGPGLSLMWGDHVAIEPALLLQAISDKPDGMDRTTLISLGYQIGLSLRL
jgi:hypothetical protein